MRKDDAVRRLLSNECPELLRIIESEENGSVLNDIATNSESNKNLVGYIRAHLKGVNWGKVPYGTQDRPLFRLVLEILLGRLTGELPPPLEPAPVTKTPRPSNEGMIPEDLPAGEGLR